MAAKPQADPNTKSYTDLNPIPEKSATATIVAENREAEFAAFEKVADAHGVEKEDKRVPPEQIWLKPKADDKPRNSDGKFAPKAEVKAEEAAPVEEQDVEADDTDYERAHAALIRSGFRRKELESMDRGEILKRGLKRAKALDADDEAHRTVKGIRTQPTDPKAAEQTSTSAKTPEVPQFDVSTVVGPLSKSLGLDDEGASTLREGFNQFAQMIGQNAVAPLAKKLASFEQAQTAKTEREFGEMMSSARAEVGKNIPDLSDPDTFDSVVEEMKILGPSKIYAQHATPRERFVACMKDACQRLKLTIEEPSAQQVQADAEAKSQRRYSRSTVSDRTKAPAVTPKEKEWQAFNDVADKHGL